MNDLKLDLRGSLITEDEFLSIKPVILSAQNKLMNRSGISSNFTGWIDYYDNFNEMEYERIKSAAKYIKDNCEALIVLGIGGSYLGARAAIESIRGDFHNELRSPQVYYAGQNLSGSYLKNLIKVINKKEICVIVISKSGTTLETALSFRIIREIMEEKYKNNLKERIFVITDKNKGALKDYSNINNYKTFIIPDNIGGRYSVITPVGLLPMAAAGLDTDSFIEGVKSAAIDYKKHDFENNICCQYAAARNILNRKGKKIEILVNYEPSYANIAEWWKQLFGESEGKEGKGIFPASLNFTTDLHSMGQFVQEGTEILFETTVVVNEINDDITIPTDTYNFDKLNYISGKTMNYINKKAFEGTFMAHCDGNVPGIILNLPAMNEYYLGKLFYFFMMSCAISGYANNIDPFTQPGVEAYKKNIKKLLEKSYD